MYRKLQIGTLSFLLVTISGSDCLAQAPTVNRPTNPTATATVTSLRPILAKMRQENKLVRGKNLVLDAKAQGNMPAFKLWATVAEGKVTKWQAVDANGKNLLTHTSRTAAGVKVVCWVCIESPLGKTCYVVDCDDLPKPKPLSRTAIQ